MKTVNNILADSCASLVFLLPMDQSESLCAYGHGDTFPLTSASGEWNFTNFEKQNGATVYITSETDISIPDKPYAGHYEFFDPECISYLPASFPYVEHPLQGYCVDKSQATLVRISLISLFPFKGNIALAANSVIPGTATTFTSLTMAKGMDGALGFIGTAPGSSTEVTLNQGIADNSTGTVSWLKQMTLSLSWDGNILRILNNPFPADWCVDTIVKLPDDTWLINIIPNPNVSEWVNCAFDGENYTGVSGAVMVSETSANIFQVSNCTDFRTKSLAVYPEKSSTNLITFPGFNFPPLDYSFSNYTIIHQRESIPSFPALCANMTKPVVCKYVDDVHYPVWLKLDTASEIYSAAITTVDPHFSFLTTKEKNGYAGDMFSAGFPCVLAYGSLNAEGVFIPAGETPIHFVVKDGVPTITAETLPAALSLGSCILQPDGNWLVTLTESSAP